MTTTHQSTSLKIEQTWFDKQAAIFEKSRFFWMAIYLTSQSCLGSVACGFILQNNASTLELGVCAALSMGSNSVLIALGPPKWCLVTVYLSFIVNTIFIIMNM